MQAQWEVLDSCCHLHNEPFKQFRDYGFTIAIDDFGTGYSSLNYIKRFALDSLKIDRSFVRDLTIGGQDHYIVTAIVNMARTMNLKVVAEGVNGRPAQLPEIYRL